MWQFGSIGYQGQKNNSDTRTLDSRLAILQINMPRTRSGTFTLCALLKDAYVTAGPGLLLTPYHCLHWEAVQTKGIGIPEHFRKNEYKALQHPVWGVHIWSLELFALEPQLSFIAALRLITSIAISIQSCSSLQAIQLSQFALFRSPALVCGWLWHLQGAKCWHNATRAFFKCSLLVCKQLQYLKCNLAYQFLDLSLQNMVYQDDAARMVALFTFPQRLKWRQQSLYLGRRPCHITTSERSSEKSFLPAMQYILELKDAIVTTHAKAIGCADVQVQEHNNNDLFSFLGNVFLDILDLEGNSALERVSKPKLA